MRLAGGGGGRIGYQSAHAASVLGLGRRLAGEEGCVLINNNQDRIFSRA
jgi:hypothetical protein